MSGVATLDLERKIPPAQLPDLSATFAAVSQSVSVSNARLAPAPGQDRIFFDPGVMVFSPQFVQSSNPVEFLGVVCLKLPGGAYRIQSLWTDDDLGSCILSDVIREDVGTDYFDPFLIKLPNGNIILGFHSGAGLFFYRSTNGGRTWAQVSMLASDAAHAYSEPCIIRLRQPGTGTPTRLVCAFTDLDPTTSRDTVIKTIFSDDEGATWSTPTTVTPISGAWSCAQLSDNVRAWIYEDAAAQVQLVYSRKATGAPAEVWAESLNHVGQSPSGTPVKVATATIANSTTGTPQNGVSPSVVRNRDGLYSLYFTAADYGTGGSAGELHQFRGDGTKSGWSGDTVILSATGAPGGWGRATPQRLSGGRLELLYVFVLGNTTVRLRSLHVKNG